MEKDKLIKILEDNEENINRGDWNAVYDTIPQNWSRGEFSQFLLENDINPNIMFKEHIPNYAFWGCKSLTSVTIPNTFTYIGYAAFAWCEKLTSITLPSSITEIDNYAFYKCRSLRSITIPNSVKEIYDKVFSKCSSLEEIKYDGTKEEWNKIKFGKDWNESCPAKVVFLR